MEQLQPLPRKRGPFGLNGWHFPISLTGKSGTELVDLPVTGRVPATPLTRLINSADQVLREAPPALERLIEVAIIIVPTGIVKDQQLIEVAESQGFGLLPVEAAIPARLLISDQWITERGNLSIPIIHHPVMLRIPKVLSISADHSVHRDRSYHLISTYWFGGSSIDYGKSDGMKAKRFSKPGRMFAVRMM